MASIPAEKRVITPDGTVIRNGVSRPAGVCRAEPEPRTTDLEPGPPLTPRAPIRSAGSAAAAGP